MREDDGDPENLGRKLKMLGSYIEVELITAVIYMKCVKILIYELLTLLDLLNEIAAMPIMRR